MVLRRLQQHTRKWPLDRTNTSAGAGRKRGVWRLDDSPLYARLDTSCFDENYWANAAPGVKSYLRDFRGLRLRRRDFEDFSFLLGDLLREAPMTTLVSVAVGLACTSAARVYRRSRRPL